MLRHYCKVVAVDLCIERVKLINSKQLPNLTSQLS